MSNTLRPNGERQEPSWKSSNRRSTSRRKLSNGRHSAGRSVPLSSFPTGSFVAVSAMSLLLTLVHDGYIVNKIGDPQPRVFDGDQNRPRQYPACAGRIMRSSLTAPTPGVTSAATRTAFFSNAESTIPHSSTVPSCTITLINDGLVHASAWSCDRRRIL